MKKFMLLVSSLFLVQSIYANEISDNKKKLIERMLEQSGQSAKQVSMMMAQQMASVIKASVPEDDKAQQIITEEVIKIVEKDFIERNSFFEPLYPIYDKYFTEEDLREIVRINDTPLGKKIIGVMPSIFQESMVQGQIIGQQFMLASMPKLQKILEKRFKEEGIDLNKLKN